LASHHHTLAALEAGMLTVCITNPLWLIKTRMQLQSQNHASNYRGMVHAFTTVVKQEGFLGLYKGIVPALALTSHGAVQFTAYERMKSWCAHSGIAMVSCLL
jgi:solute carrier family 25 (mitochondrial folate transporter), member 32